MGYSPQGCKVYKWGHTKVEWVSDLIDWNPHKITPCKDRGICREKMAIWGQRLEWCSHSWWMPGATEAGKARYDLTLEASGAWSPCHHLAVRRLVTRTQEKEPEKRRPWTPRGDILNIVKQLIFGQRNWKPDLCSQWKQRSFLLACLFGFIFNFNMSYIYIYFFNWRISVLQCCVDFCHTTMWIGSNYTYGPSLSSFPPTTPIPHLQVVQAPGLKLPVLYGNSAEVAVLNSK